MTHEFLMAEYEEKKKIVEDNNMVYKIINFDKTININLSKEEIIERVRIEAANKKIRFGSVESAISHILTHPVKPFANELIEKSSNVNFIKNQNNTIGQSEVAFQSSHISKL